MNRRAFLSITTGAALAPTQAAGPKKPNIVVILADDFGYGSLNCYGADRKLIRTPHLDRLAKEGIRFTDANTPSSVCSPTRYGLITGRYCWRTTLKYEVLATTAPLHIEPERLTVASLLKAEGYRTAAIGKWHLGYGTGKTDFTGDLRPGPLEIGFDDHFAVPQNHGDASGVYVENHRVAGLRSAEKVPAGITPYGQKYMGINAPQRVDVNVMDVLTTRAVSWIRQQNKSTPFFLYFTPVAVHQPVTPSPATHGTSAAGPLGDWIHDLDNSVGRILQALDDANATQETLLVFTSDNGGVLQTTGDRPEALATQAGLHVNGHWRGGKHGIYQGGFRVPFLVRWPGKAPAGTTSHETISLVDLLATFAAVLGKPLPIAKNAAADSFNMLPAFLGKSPQTPIRNAFITHSADGVFAIRQGPWKFIEGKAAKPFDRVPAPRRAELNPQLFHLPADPREQNNLVQQHPEVAQRLSALLNEGRDKGYTRP